MALEPITRQEQIIAGKDLEPITRMEKFLKKYGGSGGSGGVSPEEVTTIVKEQFPGGVGYSEIGEVELHRNEGVYGRDFSVYFSWSWYRSDNPPLHSLDEDLQYICTIGGVRYEGRWVTVDGTPAVAFIGGDNMNGQGLWLTTNQNKSGFTLVCFLDWYNYMAEGDKLVISAIKNKVKPISTEFLPEHLQFGEEVQTVNEPLNITWDGNTEGLVNVMGMAYKVADGIFTDEQIKIMSYKSSSSAVYTAIADMWEAAVDNGSVTDDVALIDGVLFAKKDNALFLDGTTTLEGGVYFVKQNETNYIASLTTTEPIEQTKVVTKPISAEYLPKVADLSETWIADLKAALGI